MFTFDMYFLCDVQATLGSPTESPLPRPWLDKHFEWHIDGSSMGRDFIDPNIYFLCVF